MSFSQKEIGKDILISRFFKGIATEPHKPKYALTWDVNVVLDFLRNANLDSDSDLQYLSYKTVILLALATAHRVQTITKIKISNVRETARGL